ncbi:hypothetical protein [Lentzea sp. NEAU-D7]|uniref:hypothetical protein n=1 Tax=Lentzea sp. NEAU-D7 TaxID=2994667 RepID=UPI00224B0DC2|nr:hypothetical protein [Lentzea sp. NEAU-D7]MCX2954737.1 hypothetical protein [Lentzea sp. NEAU-D7]
MRYRRTVPRSGSPADIAADLHDIDPAVGENRIERRRHLAGSVTNAEPEVANPIHTYTRFNVAAQSTWKKSHASMLAA